MKYFAIFFALLFICCLFVSQTNAIFGGDKKKEDTKGKCSLYKGRCGGKISNTCCKAPLKCDKSTSVCGKDKLCCITETDIQRHKQESGNWIAQRNG